MLEFSDNNDSPIALVVAKHVNICGPACKNKKAVVQVEIGMEGKMDGPVPSQPVVSVVAIYISRESFLWGYFQAEFRASSYPTRLIINSHTNNYFAAHNREKLVIDIQVWENKYRGYLHHTWKSYQELSV